MATKREILDLLKMLASVYNVEPKNVDAFYWTLEEYTAEQLEKAAKAHVKDSKWYPKPAELVAQASRVVADSWDPREDETKLYWLAMDAMFRPNRHLDKAWLWYCKKLSQSDNPADREWAARAVLSDDEWLEKYGNDKPAEVDCVWDEELEEWIDA